VKNSNRIIQVCVFCFLLSVSAKINESQRSPIDANMWETGMLIP